MSRTVCWYGAECRRPNCHFYHPGRDEEKAMKFDPSGFAPEELPNYSSRSNSACRYDRKCNRPDCYFSHPNGREIDDGYEVLTDTIEDELDEIDRAIEEEEEAQMLSMAGDDHDSWFPASKNCSCCEGYRLRCPCNGECKQCASGVITTPKASPSSRPIDGTVSGWAPWKDEWFPSSRDCNCCHGYRYRCEADDCRASEVCVVCEAPPTSLLPPPMSSSTTSS